MDNQNEKQISLDLLKHMENLSNDLNKKIASRTEPVLRRYPIAFGLLILFGGTVLHEGIKGLMKEIGLLEINPLYLLLIGLVILAITGTLYKKLDK